MTICEAITLFRSYIQSQRKRRTVKSYEYVLRTFGERYGEHEFAFITKEDIYQFLQSITEGFSKCTKRLRYAQLKAFFGMIIDRFIPEMKNPCNNSLLSKTFRMPKQIPRKILDREVVEEMIYNTKSQRDRLIIELQARCGLRIGELLNIHASDVSDRTIALREPKSGKDGEVAYMPEPISRKLAEYIRTKEIKPEERVFPICYSTARSLIQRLGTKLQVRLSPHDLRRYSATYASRNGVPLEIVSKIILRHQDLKTTQVYLGRISESEAIRWMDVLHGK